MGTGRSSIGVSRKEEPVFWAELWSGRNGEGRDLGSAWLNGRLALLPLGRPGGVGSWSGSELESPVMVGLTLLLFLAGLFWGPDTWVLFS